MIRSRLSQSSSNAITLDAPTSSSGGGSDDGNRVGFIEGSRPQITNETTDLLRLRLRAAAGFLALAFGAFLIWRLISGAAVGPRDEWTLTLHISTTIVLCSSFILLCRKCMIPLNVLRGYELVIFGLPVAYFLVQDYDTLKLMACEGYLPSPLAHWMGIAFVYAMFIPNSWRRAAVALGIICLAPMLLIAYLWAQDPMVVRAMSVHRMFGIELLIMMSVTYFSATYGTHMIGALRREAFEARQLGQYRLCRLIGSGGMGEVYLAEHRMMKRPVAIKLIRPGKANDPHALARFEREVRATAKLSHWNTIEIFDYGRADDGTFYYVMEYLPGLSLLDLVEKHGPLPPARAVHFLMQTCDALAEAHAHGLIHRDIKPGNIFSAERGGVYDVAKLLDFGLAKPLTSTAAPVQLTQDGAITGSPMFMSPEQAVGDNEPDARSDIYSLGGVAYFLLTGVPPFESDKPVKLILAHAQQVVVPPSRLRAEIPQDVERVVLRCLAKNPTERYQSAAELRRALAECVAGGGWTHDDAALWWQSHVDAQPVCGSLEEAAI